MIEEVVQATWLQSGGFADVFLVDGLVYKFFHIPNSELPEFKNVDYIMNKQAQGYDLSQVVSYVGHGYTLKYKVFDIYMRCAVNGKSSQDRFIAIRNLINSYASYNSIPFVCMKYLSGMDGMVSQTHQS
jgi:hypothetical protein